MIGPRMVPWDYVVVTRRINRTISSLGPVLHVLASGPPRLRVSLPFASSRSRHPVLHTTGRMYSSRRVVRATVVDLELTPWSHDVTEVRMRPVTRRLLRWGERRQARYFALAPTTIDQVARALDAAAARHDVASRSFRPFPIALTDRDRPLPTRR